VGDFSFRLAASLGSRLWVLLLLSLALVGGFPGRAWSARGGETAASGTQQRAYHPGPDTTGPIITDTASPEALGTATLFMPWFLSFTGGRFSPGWGRVGAGGNYRSLFGSVQLYVGVGPYTSVYIVVPYEHNWAWNVNQPGPEGQRSANFGGLGDISITGKHLLVDEQPHFPAVAGIFSVTFPSGHHLHLNPGNLGTDLLGQGCYSFTPGLNFFKYVPPVLLYANLWYTMYTGAKVGNERLNYRDRVTVNLALEWPIVRDRLNLLWELVSFYDAGRLLGPPANSAAQALISTEVGIEFLATKHISLVPGILIDLAGKNINYTYTPNFSFFYYF
jgi:hypothetical protein